MGAPAVTGVEVLANHFVSRPDSSSVEGRRRLPIRTKEIPVHLASRQRLSSDGDAGVRSELPSGGRPGARRSADEEVGSMKCRALMWGMVTVALAILAFFAVLCLIPLWIQVYIARFAGGG